MEPTRAVTTQSKNARGLSAREQLFIESYLKVPNATQAALAAGYASKHATKAAADVIARPHVAKELRRRQDQLIDRYQLSSDRVIRELCCMAFSNMEDYTRVTPGGDRVFDLTNCTREQLAAVVDMQVDTSIEIGRDEIERQVKRTRVKLGNKHEALMSLGKHLGLFKEERLPAGHNISFTLRLANGGEAPREVRVHATVALPETDGGDLRAEGHERKAGTLQLDRSEYKDREDSR